MVFEEKGCFFLFDQEGAVDAVQADRTLAAWAVTPDVVDKRDTWYQSGFPVADLGDGTARDRGHLLPHLSGGKFGPNIFAQDRALNRGWSEEGKRYRAIERLAAASPGAFFVGRLIYLDDTDYPAWVEIGTVIDGVVHSDRFDNRNGATERVCPTVVACGRLTGSRRGSGWRVPLAAIAVVCQVLAVNGSPDLTSVLNAQS